MTDANKRSKRKPADQKPSARGRHLSGMPSPLVADDDHAPVDNASPVHKQAKEILDGAYAEILRALELMGYDIHDDNFRDTGPRAAKGLLELVLPVAEIETAVDELIARSFSARYDEMVISKHNVCFGVCPHHLLPVIYRVSLAYLPSTKVLGISKLSRLARLLARRPVLQEELTQNLAEVLHSRLKSRGSAVYIEGLHMCMAARGSESHEARVVTSSVRGMFRTQPATRQEFLDLVTAAPLNLI